MLLYICLTGVLDFEETANLYFVNTMISAYPQELGDLYETDIHVLQSRIMASKVIFIQEASTSYGVVDITHSVDSETNQLLNERSRRSTGVYSKYFINNSSAILSNNITFDLWNLTNKSHFEVQHDDRSLPFEVDLAHIFHYCSISILAILVIEVIIYYSGGNHK
jgi:hypothetical protein